jgi:TonB-dependent SusC/RagA subfamily outer membrane receptor
LLTGFNTTLAQKATKQPTGKKVTISGIVVDAENNPLTGGMVIVDGESTGILTNNKGMYKVRVSSSAKLLGISVINVHLLEEAINGRKKVDFRFGNYTQKMILTGSNDEDVDIGYGSVKKKNNTNSSNAIDSQNKKYASYQNIYDMISGEIPGVQVVGRSIRIQGISSINSGTGPLLVVDDVMVSTIDNILPRMVKSIEVLKGTGAAIYGSRGANGVVLITLVGRK